MKPFRDLETDKSMMPVYPRDRISYLVGDLVNRDDWVTISVLASVLYVTSKTISRDLKEVEKILEDYDLVIERKPHYGIKVQGSEISRRACLASLTVGVDYSPFKISKEDTKRILMIMEEVFFEHDVEFTSVAQNSFFIHMVIAIKRAKSGNYIHDIYPMQSKSLNEQDITIASDLFYRIGKSFDCSFNENEIILLNK